MKIRLAKKIIKSGWRYNWSQKRKAARRVARFNRVVYGVSPLVAVRQAYAEYLEFTRLQLAASMGIPACFFADGDHAFSC